ncbi:MAG: M48 family metallopeptidase [Methylococcaceae bacterium]|nr:M48 family metallopeptidase [Methylococcaceae bacterium]
MQFEANYYDGISPRAKRVLVTIQDVHFLFTVSSTHADETLASHELHYPINDCIVQAKLSSGKRLIDLPDDSRLETDFQDLERYLPAKSANLFWYVVHYAENHKLIIAVTLLSIVCACVLLLKYGVPVMAKYAVIATPASVEKYLGKQTLETLDHEKIGYFAITSVPVARQNAIQTALTTLCEKTGDCPAYQLNFRKSPLIGANAFALPGGDIVITDELIALAKNDDEIIAVLAHELGHVKGRHALRQTLQGTISGLIIVSITGDANSLAASLPTLALNMRYSRDLETEADDYALQALKTTCIPTESFANILLKLEKVSGGKSVSMPEIVSSHPDTEARVIPFLKDRSKPCTVGRNKPV